MEIGDAYIHCVVDRKYASDEESAPPESTRQHFSPKTGLVTGYSSLLRQIWKACCCILAAMLWKPGNLLQHLQCSPHTSPLTLLPSHFSPHTSPLTLLSSHFSPHTSLLTLRPLLTLPPSLTILCGRCVCSSCPSRQGGWRST